MISATGAASRGSEEATIVFKISSRTELRYDIVIGRSSPFKMRIRLSRRPSSNSLSLACTDALMVSRLCERFHYNVGVVVECL